MNRKLKLCGSEDLDKRRDLREISLNDVIPTVEANV